MLNGRVAGRDWTLVRELGALREAVGEDWNQVVLLEDEARLVEDSSGVNDECFDAPSRFSRHPRELGDGLGVEGAVVEPELVEAPLEVRRPGNV